MGCGGVAENIKTYSVGERCTVYNADLCRIIFSAFVVWKEEIKHKTMRFYLEL